MGAEAIVITEKDAVKIPMEVVHAGSTVPVYVICVEVNFQAGKDEFKALLAERLAEKLGQPQK
jgi:tetraacyldisaccharide-1-P 4'-kinase